MLSPLWTAVSTCNSRHLRRTRSRADSSEQSWKRAVAGLSTASPAATICHSLSRCVVWVGFCTRTLSWVVVAAGGLAWPPTPGPSLASWCSSRAISRDVCDWHLFFLCSWLSFRFAAVGVYVHFYLFDTQMWPSHRTTFLDSMSPTAAFSTTEDHSLSIRWARKLKMKEMRQSRLSGRKIINKPVSSVWTISAPALLIDMFPSWSISWTFTLGFEFIKICDWFICCSAICCCWWCCKSWLHSNAAKLDSIVDLVCCWFCTGYVPIVFNWLSMLSGRLFALFTASSFLWTFICLTSGWAPHIRSSAINIGSSEDSLIEMYGARIDMSKSSSMFSVINASSSSGSEPGLQSDGKLFASGL